MIVSFEADHDLYPPSGHPPGLEVATIIADGLARAGLSQQRPSEREGWAWDIIDLAGPASVEVIIGMPDDPPRQWQASINSRAPTRRRLLGGTSAERDRATVLQRWCSAIHEVLDTADGISAIRWYSGPQFDADHGATWLARPE
jgi:hypothetical protein